MMLKTRLFACMAGLLLSVTHAAADPKMDEKSGIKVGEKAPTFALKDQAGKERTLEEFLKKGNVAIVFYRSASW